MSIWTWQFYFLKAENGKPYNFRKIGNHIRMYGINNWLLREYAGFLTSPVCDIVNSSFAEQKLPRSWKDADVSPLMKVKPVTIITKHIRPISLTSALSQLVEEFIVSKYIGPAVLELLILTNSAQSQNLQLFMFSSMVHTWAQASDGTGSAVRVVLLGRVVQS